MNLYTGFDVRSHGIERLDIIDPVQRHRIDSLQGVTTDVDMEPEYEHLVAHAVATQPATYALKTVVQAVRYWTVPPWYDAQLRSLPFLIVRVLPILFLVLMSIPLFRGYHEYTHLLRPLILTLAYFTLVYALTHTSNIRFKLDVEWLQCVPAGIGISTIMAAKSKTLSEKR